MGFLDSAVNNTSRHPSAHPGPLRRRVFWSWFGPRESRTLKILLICTALSFACVSSAMAQSGAGACAADIKKVCANIESGSGRVANCLKDRIADLSDVCKARLAEVAAARKACRAEVEKQCGTKTRRVQKVTCIRGALANLGDDCKTAIAAAVTRKK